MLNDIFEQADAYMLGEKNDWLARMAEGPTDHVDKENLAQFFTPPDVALHVADRLLTAPQSVFDPSFGKGALLIASGIVLAEKFGLRGADLLSYLYGTELSAHTADIAYENIAICLDRYLDGLSKTDAITLLRKQLHVADFLSTDIPTFSAVYANPPYLETENGNVWIPFCEKIVTHGNNCALIIPVSVCSAKRTEYLRNLLLANYHSIIASHHETRPQALFPRIEQRITLLVARTDGNDTYATTGFLTTTAKNRSDIWKAPFTNIPFSHIKNIFPKITPEELPFYYDQMNPNISPIGGYIGGLAQDIWIRSTGRYHVIATPTPPTTETTKWHCITLPETSAEIVLKAFEEGIALRWWQMFGDGRDISLTKLLSSLRIPF